MSAPDLSALGALPLDADGPVFREPWEAKAFAMAVELNRRGVFAWSEWAAALGREIAAAGDGAGYYDCWLRALERLVVEKELATAAGLDATAEAWRRAAEATPHGEAVVLGRGASS